VAVDTGYIKPEEENKILRFRDDPSDEGWMKEE
jgi:orotate phosphoribosyltransferase